MHLEFDCPMCDTCLSIEVPSTEAEWITLPPHAVSVRKFGITKVAFVHDGEQRTQVVAKIREACRLSGAEIDIHVPEHW